MGDEGTEQSETHSVDSLQRRKLELEIRALSSWPRRVLDATKALAPVIAIIGTIAVGLYTGLFDRARLALEWEKLSLQEEQIERARVAKDPKLRELGQEVAHKSRELETTSELVTTLRGQLVESERTNGVLLNRVQDTSSRYSQLTKANIDLQQDYARLKREDSRTRARLDSAERQNKALATPIVAEQRVFDLCLNSEGEHYECGNIEGKFLGDEPGEITLAIDRHAGDGWVEKTIPKYSIQEWFGTGIEYQIDRGQWPAIFAPRRVQEPRRGNEQRLRARVRVKTADGQVSDWSHIDRQTWRVIDNQFVARTDEGQHKVMAVFRGSTGPFEVPVTPIDHAEPVVSDDPDAP